MAEKTDLNVAPYYDDYSAGNNYLRTLFRPGFAIQARELTQLQSQLQHQIEQHGSHIFKEGAQVIPGQISINTSYYSLKLASTFAGETVDPSQYYNATTPVIITGFSPYSYFFKNSPTVISFTFTLSIVSLKSAGSFKVSF